LFAAVTAPDEKKLRIASFATHATRGIIRDQSSRRKMMGATLVVAVLLLIAGSTVLQDLLNPREHAVRFILYWLACAWFTVAALLLALFDALMVRAQGRAARKTLGREYSPDQTAPAEEDEDDK
jgi:protein-S-isoprenylcysteine O-methyltransferase Ste14